MQGTNKRSSQTHRTAESTIRPKPAGLEAKHNSMTSTLESPYITLDHGNVQLDDTVAKTNADLDSLMKIEAKRAHLNSASAVIKEKVDACSNTHSDIFASQQKLEDTNSEVEDDFDNLPFVQGRVTLTATRQVKSHGIETEVASPMAGSLPKLQPSTAGGKQLPQSKLLQSPRQRQQVQPGAYIGVAREESQSTIAPSRGAAVLDAPTKQASVESKLNALNQSQEVMLSLSDQSPTLQEKDKQCSNCCKTMDARQTFMKNEDDLDLSSMNTVAATAMMRAQVKDCRSNQTKELQTPSSCDGVQTNDRHSEAENDSFIMQIVAERASLAFAEGLAEQGSTEMKKPVPTFRPVVDGGTDSPWPDAEGKKQPAMMQPGAYLGLPGEAMQRAVTIDFSIVGACSSHNEMESSDDSMSSIKNHQQHLAEANPVLEDAEDGTMMHANAVDLDELQNRQLQSKKQQHFFTFALILLFLAGVLIVGYVGVAYLKKEVVAAQVPSADISREPSEAPSSAPTSVLDLLFLDLPLSTQENILNGHTPQNQAWDWLSKHQNITNFPDWRKRQLFAMAAFFFAFEGEDWNPLIQERWMDDTLEECLWFSSGFGRFEGVEYIEWSLEIDGYPQLDPCNSLGQYTNLELGDLQLSGFAPSIPPEIYLLSSLTAISLYDNGIEALNGMLPSQIYQMPHLRWLFYDTNPFHGSLPTELGLLTNLTALDFENSILSGFICSELGEMTSLGSLDLSAGFLSGPIPSELGLLTNLLWLGLRNLTLLTGSIPSELSLLSSLRHLDLRNSSGLSGRIPDELCYLLNSSCTFVDFWNKTSQCTLGFDCTETLCGCDCPCANDSMVVGTLIDIIPCAFC